ncbi:hypothetical protein PENSPDRAFT_650386 [Peniophora sp. CONT]|nr:hypothetical protein PENSPDRAFT_650386 [Peniophora sp. CONT]
MAGLAGRFVAHLFACLCQPAPAADWQVYDRMIQTEFSDSSCTRPSPALAHPALAHPAFAQPRPISPALPTLALPTLALPALALPALALPVLALSRPSQFSPIHLRFSRTRPPTSVVFHVR